MVSDYDRMILVRSREYQELTVCVIFVAFVDEWAGEGGLVAGIC
jgi:hypothetical protein